MKRNQVIAGVLAAAVMATAGLAVAMDVDVHGSVSQGWIKTTEYNYLVPDAKNGSAEFNEMVLNFNSQVSDKLRVGVQFLGRDFGDAGNNEMVVDWALGDYRVNDAFGVRMGKFKIPYGLYNKTRDIDFLRTSIMLPQGIYQELFREVLGGCQGGSVYGSWKIFDYEAFAGTVDLNRTRFGSTTMGKYVNGALLQFLPGVAAQVEAATTIAPDIYADVDMDIASYEGTMDAVFGYGITVNPPIEGLRLSHTALTSDLKLQANYASLGHAGLGPVLHPLDGSILYPGLSIDNVSIDATLEIDYVTTVSAEYVTGNLSLAGEFQQAKVKFTPDLSLPGMDVPDAEQLQARRSYYGMANYRVNDLLELGGYYSFYTEDWHDVDSDVPASYQKDIAFTTRVDVTDGWTLKAEYHLIKGLADLSPNQHPEVFFSPTRNDLEDSWTMFALKTTYSF